ncbi:YtxH domain-containing protein [Nafulsella turpanensis]|uniref:YtxH domain-containing protein n=1 Tax=Nafulsella turpanensis TaxID=1265690 RepID=UPI0003475174|nr:YtxH domain-containing protein [Nafulsella turpanensis]
MNNSDKSLFAFLAGTAAGIAIGMLMAPDSGRMTRDKLSRQADALVNDLEDQWEVGFEKIRDLTNSALAEAERLRERGEREIDDLKG